MALFAPKQDFYTALFAPKQDFLQIARSTRCEWGGAILSPHDALRAYTVLLTAEPRRGSSRVLSSLVI